MHQHSLRYAPTWARAPTSIRLDTNTIGGMRLYGPGIARAWSTVRPYIIQEMQPNGPGCASMSILMRREQQRVRLKSDVVPPLRFRLTYILGDREHSSDGRTLPRPFAPSYAHISPLSLKAPNILAGRAPGVHQHHLGRAPTSIRARTNINERARQHQFRW